MYVVMHLDRHVDPEPILFTDRDVALARAQGIVQEYVDEGRGIHVDEELEPSMREAGWLYYGTWNHEGDDYVFVIERPVDEPDPRNPS